MPSSNETAQTGQNTSTIQHILQRFTKDQDVYKKNIQAALKNFTPDEHQKLENILEQAEACAQMTIIYSNANLNRSCSNESNIARRAWRHYLTEQLTRLQSGKKQTSAEPTKQRELTSTTSHREIRSYGANEANEANEDTFIPITFQFAKEKQSKRKKPPTKTNFIFNPVAKPFTPIPNTQKKASPPLRTTTVYR